jgi:hypothetical protein
VKRVQFTEISFQRLIIFIQAADTFCSNTGRKARLDKNSLWRPRQLNLTHQLLKIQVASETNGWKVEVDLAAGTDRCVDQKAGIDP